MSLSLDKLVQLIKKDPSFYPFNDEFDLTKFLSKLRSYKKIDEKAAGLIKFLPAVHEYYKALVKEIYNIFELLGLSHTDLRILLFRTLNEETFKTNAAVLDRIRSIDALPDPESLHFLSIKNQGGDELHVGTIQQIHVDITAELLAILVKRETSTSVRRLENIDKDFILKHFYRLWVAGNIICNLRDVALDQVLWDKCHIEWTGKESVKISHPLPIIEFTRTASEIRSTNHRIQLTSLLRPVYNKSKVKRKKIKVNCIRDGEVNIKIIENDSIEEYLETHVSLLKYHPHLANVPITFFDDTTITKLIEIFALLLELFDDFGLTKKESIVTEKNIPVWISYKGLVQAVTECIGLAATTIRKFIDSLCCDPAAPYLWRYPFYREDDKLFFSVYVLHAPNTHLFIDSWIQQDNFRYNTLVKWFRDFILFESREHKTGYEFSILTPEFVIEEQNVFFNNFCYITRDTVLLLELCIFPYPIEYSEHAAVLDHLSRASYMVKEKSVSLAEQYPETVNNKKIISVILTEYPSYSGISMNGIPVVDVNLLHNYFFTGEFAKKASSLVPGANKLKNLASLRYYKDENSFNSEIQNFLSYPPPVTQLVNNMTIQPAIITPSFLPLKVTVEKVEHIGEQQEMMDRVGDIERLMLYEYHVDPAEPEVEAIDDNIQYHFSVILHKLAYAKYLSHTERWSIVNAFIHSRRIGQVHLITYLLGCTSELPGNIIRNENHFRPVLLSTDTRTLFERLKIYLEKRVTFSEFEMPAIFTESEERMLISVATEIINQHAYKSLDERDIDFLMLNLLILSSLQFKYSIKELFYTGCTNFIDLLNSSHHYQKARDFSEELLALSIKNNDHAYGWYNMFNCYTAQNNSTEATLYACLYFSSIKYTEKIEYHFIVNGGFALLKFFRNFGYYEFSKMAYKNLCKLDLDVTDEQKISNVHFSTLYKSLNKDPQAMDELFVYLDKNEQAITDRKTQSCMPWLGLLYNLKRLEERKIYFAVRPLDPYINRLEMHCDQNIVRQNRNKILGTGKNNKALFIKALSLAFETRDSSDIPNELNNLTVQAGNLIHEGLQTGDTENILLASLVLSDLTFVYENKQPMEGKAPLIKIKNTALFKRLKNYQAYFLNEIHLRKGQLLIWMFRYDTRYGFLMLNDKKEISVHQFSIWMEKELTEWTKNISSFYFNSSRKKLIDYDLSEQIKDYKNCLAFFSYTAIRFQQNITELLICNSIEMTDMPHNLLVRGNDFIAAQIPVCNVLSPAYFISNNIEIHLPNLYKLSAWIPTEEGNLQIQWGYSLLEPLLNKYNAETKTSHYPDSPLNGDINIFLAHGVREFGGFKAVRTSNDPRSSILHPAKVFGKGTVAVLFICNAGSLTEDTYAIQVVSLSTQLLKLGYKAVVASFWPYDVTMSYRWLRIFLESLDAGLNINQAVFHANNKLAEYDIETSNLFYAPAGRFAMHLYGNPNIRIREMKAG